MFLSYIKNFWLKKILKNKLYKHKTAFQDAKIETIGILIDESRFGQKESLIKELVHYGINENNISVLVYKDKIKKNEEFIYPTISLSSLNWNGVFSKTEANDFKNRKFDLLINYYDIEKTALVLISSTSKAQFITGFSVIDKRLNDLMITTHIENYKVFAHELIRYLKILNKL